MTTTVRDLYAKQTAIIKGCYADLTLDEINALIVGLLAPWPDLAAKWLAAPTPQSVVKDL